MHLTVVICTHNPREDYLRRTLEALEEQTISLDEWELLLIDNASNEHLSEKWDLSWHPAARHVREDELGLTHARLRGIREAAAELLVFVDDDNVLNSNFLSCALEISKSYPWVGIYGGSILGEYEVLPREEIKPRLHQLAVRHVDRMMWAYLPGTLSLVAAPCGAGMVVRRKIAECYAINVSDDGFRVALGRRGASLASGEDSDLACCAFELGYAVGQFPELALLHLIPGSRLEDDYLVRLAEAMTYSYAILCYCWDGAIPPNESQMPAIGRADKLLQSYKRLRHRMKSFIAGNPPVFKSFTARISEAEAIGYQRARRDILVHAKQVANEGAN